jgi:hypothetical protein
LWRAGGRRRGTRGGRRRTGEVSVGSIERGGDKYLAAGEHQFAAEDRGAVRDEPFCGVVAILAACGPGVLGRESIADREDSQLIVVGHVFEVCILAVCVSYVWTLGCRCVLMLGLQHPTATMDVQMDAFANA